MGLHGGVPAFETHALRTGSFHGLLFLAGSVAWMLATGIAVGIFLALSGPTVQVDDPALLGAASMFQILGIGLLSLQLGRWLKSMLGDASSLADFLGFRRVGAAWLVGAAVGGTTVWTFPVWLSNQLMPVLGSDGSALTVVAEALRRPWLDTWPLVLAVGVSAPLVEELIFRGYVWTVVERVASPAVAFVVSTLVFAAYHMDPVQVLALLPTSAFLGVLRWQSGSVWPAVVAHFVNNGLAIATARLGPEDPTVTLPLWAALGGLVATAGVVAVVMRTRQ